MRLLRRLIAWSCFFGLLTAVGAGVFHFVRYRPRCTIEGPLVVRHLSPDGRWLVAEAMSQPKRDSDAQIVLGLRVFDAHSGRLVRSVPALAHDFVQSPDGRHFVGQTRDGPLQIIDWQSGKVWSPPVNHRRAYAFSPRGRWLWLDADRVEGRNVVVDLPAHRLAPWPGDLLPQFTPDDRYGLCLVDAGTISVVDLESGRTTATLRPDFAMDRVGIRLSSDGRRAVIGNVRSPESRRTSRPVVWESCEPIEQFVFLNLEVWDLVDFRRVWAWKQAADAEFSTPALSPDGRRLAYWTRTKQGPRLEMVDLQSGAIQMILAENADSHFPRRLRFLDSAVLLTKDSVFSLHTVTADGRVVWRQEQSTRVFESNANIVLQWGEQSNELHAVNIGTGKACRVSPVDFEENPGRSTILSGGGSHVAIIGNDTRPPHDPGPIEEWLRAKWPWLFSVGRSGVVIVETATGRECLRLMRNDRQIVQLSADGRTLVTFAAIVDKGMALDWDHSLITPRVSLWDVYPQRAWFWAVIASASVAVVLLLLCHWRRRRKAAKRESMPA